MLSMKKNSFQEIRVNKDEYNNHPFYDIRIYTKGEGGKYYPTRQGLAVPEHIFEKFTEMIVAENKDA
jgi:hypothetical protein